MIKEDEEEREKFIRGRERDEKKSIIRKIKKKTTRRHGSW